MWRPILKVMSWDDPKIMWHFILIVKLRERSLDVSNCPVVWKSSLYETKSSELEVTGSIPSEENLFYLLEYVHRLFWRYTKFWCTESLQMFLLPGIEPWIRWIMSGHYANIITWMMKWILIHLSFNWYLIRYAGMQRDKWGVLYQIYQSPFNEKRRKLLWV